MADFPTLLHSGSQHLKFLKRHKDWASVTVVATFEDGGADFQKSAADAPQVYELFYDGLTETAAKVYDDFWDAHGIDTPFTFYEPRNVPWTGEGSTITNCYFKSYEKDHTKVGIQSRRIEIIKYPA